MGNELPIGFGRVRTSITLWTQETEIGRSNLFCFASIIADVDSGDFSSGAGSRPPRVSLAEVCIVGKAYMFCVFVNTLKSFKSNFENS